MTSHEQNLLPFSTLQCYALPSAKSKTTQAANNKEMLGECHDIVWCHTIVFHPSDFFFLWCAGGKLSLLFHFLFSLFFSQKSPPIRRARTPDKHGAIEGAEFSWSSELSGAGVGLPKLNPREHMNQSAWFVGVFEEKFIRHGASRARIRARKFPSRNFP